MKTRLLIAAAAVTLTTMAAATFGANSAFAQAQTQDYRCILDSVSKEDHQAAVALYSKLFVESIKDQFPANPHETEALEARMDKLSDDCAARNHWTPARQAKVENYTGDYFIQNATVYALSRQGVSDPSLERIWNQLTPADLAAVAKLPDDQPFVSRSDKLLDAERAPHGPARPQPMHT